MIATPNVPPSSRAVSLTADPTPALAGGSAPMMASVAGALTRPSPPPMKSIWPTTNQYDEVAESRVVQAKPMAIEVRPAATIALVPNRSASLALSGAAIPVKRANGTVRTPASSVP